MWPERDLLAEIHVASPCGASWEEMRGDEQVRFCEHCRKNVYNLSGMSRRKAEALVRETEGRLCVRFYRRRDGTVLTDNCPVGLRRARRWLLTHIVGLSAVFCGLIALAEPFVRVEALRNLVERLNRVTTPIEQPSAPAMMGSPPPTPPVQGDIPVHALGTPAVPPPAPGPVILGRIAIPSGKHLPRRK